MKNTIYKYRYVAFSLVILTIYFFNMFIDIMEVDAAQYAFISMEMSWTRSFLQVFQYGQDYLDKPPLLFWLSSLSYLLIGISNFAYKLPSVLVLLLGIYSTYRFAEKYYGKEKAGISALILASSQALFLITNDVRTDTLLLGWTIFSVWQISEFLDKNKWGNLLFAGIGIAAAMMSKGPIVLIILAAGFGFDILLKGEWKKIFKPHWIVLLIFIAVLLLPMSYGLYTQFDLHPEKTVYGIESPSGLRFFYWTQSFGRITGEIYWDNNLGFFFFFHSILWDFQPWIFLFIPALIVSFVKLIKQKFKIDAKQELITLGGFILPFLALSTSNYKLPHYIFVLFPFAAIITANFIVDLKEKIQLKVANIYFGVMQLFWLICLIYFSFFFPPNNLTGFILPFFLLILFVMNIFIFKKSVKYEKILFPALMAIIALNFVMTFDFYPNILKYQASSQVGKKVFNKEIDKDKFYYYNVEGQNVNFTLDLYARNITPFAKLEQINNLKDCTIYTDRAGLHDIDSLNINYKIIDSLQTYRVTALSLDFLYHKTRDKAVEREYLIKIE